MRRTKVLVAGAGPTGLGAAHRLWESGEASWLLIDAAPTAGGNASSVQQAGFVFDVGSHVIHSHDTRFDRLLDSVPGGCVTASPARGSVLGGAFVPAPVQLNVHRLPAGLRDLCLIGLQAAHGDRPPAHLGDYFLGSFGRGLTDLFFGPLTTKQWAARPDELSARWVNQRSGSRLPNVPTVDATDVARRCQTGEDRPAWGAGETIRTPRFGGTGAIWAHALAQLPPEKVRLGRRVVRVDSANRVAWTADGESWGYDWLISSLPIDAMVGMAGLDSLRRAAGLLRRAACWVVGVGFAGRVAEPFRGLASVLWPGPEVPFWRTAFPTHLSPHNVPNGGQDAVVAEVTALHARSGSAPRVVNAVIAGLRRSGVLPRGATVVRAWSRFLPWGYPVPTLERDDALAELLPSLADLGILSRGRFGGWKYEVSNQDHAFLQGWEAVDRVLAGRPETTLFTPEHINR